MNNKFRYGGIIIFTVLLLASILGLFGMAAAEDTLIIYYGVGTYRALTSAVKVLCGIFAACSIVTGALEARRYMLVEKKEAERIAADQEKLLESDRLKREKESVLSVSKRLDEGTIRSELSENMKDEWNGFSEGIGILIGQSEKMDDLQARLGELLRKNGAEKLDDAEDILDRVEQGMLKNIRKVLNYMEIGSRDRSEDCKKVGDSIEECIGENKELLENTSGFLLSLTDYLNSQGENDRDELETLTSYKDILIKSTKTK
ncbi:MAG: hypothetical protein K6B14_00685 [Lachnospiraceae bacterium]|nr:hypothetical protein [Lachnospiraceae bacterium]